METGAIGRRAMLFEVTATIREDVVDDVMRALRAVAGMPAFPVSRLCATATVSGGRRLVTRLDAPTFTRITTVVPLEWLDLVVETIEACAKTGRRGVGTVVVMPGPPGPSRPDKRDGAHDDAAHRDARVSIMSRRRSQRNRTEDDMTIQRTAVAKAAAVGMTLVTGVRAPVAGRVGAQTPPGSIVGAWTLNKAQSDKPPEGVPDVNAGRPDGAVDRGGRGFGRSGGFGRRGSRGQSGPGPTSDDDLARMRDALRDVTEAPERLTIVQTESMVVITTGEGRTMRLSTDGTKITDESTNIERRSKWVEGKLVTDIIGMGRARITETYAVDAERHQLSVTIQQEPSRLSRGMTIRRVYDAELR